MRHGQRGLSLCHTHEVGRSNLRGDLRGGVGARGGQCRLALSLGGAERRCERLVLLARRRLPHLRDLGRQIGRVLLVERASRLLRYLGAQLVGGLGTPAARLGKRRRELCLCRLPSRREPHEELSLNLASDLCRGRRHRRLHLRRPLLLRRFERLSFFRAEGGLRTRRRRRHRRVAFLFSEVTCGRKGRFLLRLCRLCVPLVGGGDGGGFLLVH